MGIDKKERFWLQEHGKRARGYGGLRGHVEPLKLRGSTKLGKSA
jgi:hypothetical protein